MSEVVACLLGAYLASCHARFTVHAGLVNTFYTSGSLLILRVLRHTGNIILEKDARCTAATTSSPIELVELQCIFMSQNEVILGRVNTFWVFNSPPEVMDYLLRRTKML